MVTATADTRRGFSLVELIVVLAIVALLAGIALPSLVHMGAFSVSETDETARDLLNLLKAARIYASTFNVRTAVVYTLAEIEDHEAPGKIYVAINGMGLARAMSEKEGAEAGVIDNLRSTYILVRNDAGSLMKYRDGACLRVLAPESPTGSTTDEVAPIDAAAWRHYSKLKLYMEYVFLKDDTNGDGIYEEEILPRMDYGSDAGAFPAHVFLPTGELKCKEGGSAQRVSLEVIPSPTLASSDRYLEDGTPVPPVVVNLYVGTGRAVIHNETESTS